MSKTKRTETAVVNLFVEEIKRLEEAGDLDRKAEIVLRAKKLRLYPAVARKLKEV